VTLASKALPYGLRDVQLTPLGVDGATPGTMVDLPASQTLSFSETEDFEELRGDDTVQASHGSGPVVEWELESGGISLEAYATMAGGTVVTTGVSPNVSKRYTKQTTDARPYFKIEGRAINDNGGDFHGIIYRAKADGSLEGTLEDATFWVTSASGKGYGSLEAGTLDRVYDFIHNETAMEIVGSSNNVNEIQAVVVDATGGNFKLTYSAQTTADIAFDATPGAVQTALEALSNIAPGDVVVTGTPGNYNVEFTGTLASTNVAKMTTAAGTAPLTGGSASAVVYVVREGA
jgi:hypothetical protein